MLKTPQLRYLLTVIPHCLCFIYTGLPAMPGKPKLQLAVN